MGLEFQVNNEKKINSLRLYNKLKLLALNIFEWKNLPNNIESRHIEKALFTHGQAIFYDHKELGLICLPCSNTNNTNAYGETKVVTTSGFNIIDRVEVVNRLKSKDEILEVGLPLGVNIANNDLLTPTELDVIDYANKLYEVEKAINLNIRQQKFPYLIATDTNTKLSMEQLIKDVEDGKMAIFHSKHFDISKLNVFNLNVPFVVDKLQQYKMDLNDEILTFFGLNNVYQKRERMLVDEVNAKNDYIDRNIALMYKGRKKACDLINEIYKDKLEKPIEVVKVQFEDDELKEILKNFSIKDEKMEKEDI